jgi:hypothetical protein
VNTRKITGVVLALGALLMSGAGLAQASEAGTLDISSSADAGSRIRTDPYIRPGNITATISHRTAMNIECFANGQYYDDGQTHTDVWYFGSVSGPRGYVWGGNVNTQQDPLREC